MLAFFRDGNLGVAEEGECDGKEPGDGHGEWEESDDLVSSGILSKPGMSFSLQASSFCLVDCSWSSNSRNFKTFLSSVMFSCSKGIWNDRNYIISN